MRYRKLGSTGLTVSELGFGCGAVGGLMTEGRPDDQRRAVARALEAGITYFDTAPSYGQTRSETNLGRVLAELDAWDKVVVGTKVRIEKSELGNVRATIRDSLDASLNRLGRPRVDLLQLHNNVGGEGEGDLLSPARILGEIVPMLRELAAEGRTGFIGFTGLGETEALHEVVESRAFDTVQCYFNALNPSAGHAGAAAGRQDFAGLIDAAAAAGMGVICIRVLAGGAASGSAERAENASAAAIGARTAGASFGDDVRRALSLRSLLGHDVESTTALSLRFVLAKEAVSTALIGYSDQAQLEAAISWEAAGALSPAQAERVVQAAR
jgi:aryl-alcohol dehydrogenase-like predicted oxidoreductase